MPDWLQKKGIEIFREFLGKKHLNIFMILEGQGGERAQFVPRGLQNTEFLRCLQKI